MSPFVQRFAWVVLAAAIMLVTGLFVLDETARLGLFALAGTLAGMAGLKQPGQKKE